MIYEPQEMDQTMGHSHKKYNKTSKCFIHTELAASDAFLDHTSKIGKLFANGIQWKNIGTIGSYCLVRLLTSMELERDFKDRT